jgi:hypothetical protein
LARRTAPTDSDRLERGAALALRTWVFLLAGYIVFNKTFPFYLLAMPVLQMTGMDLLMLLLRAVLGLAVAAWLFRQAFAPPPLLDRHRVFCENWVGLGLGLTSLIAAACFAYLIKGDGVISTTARLLARGILWLVF